MGLNVSKGNMYSWVSGTKNPLAGQCLHNCSYCSTNTLKRFPVIQKKYSGPIRLEEKILKENLGNGNTWFIVGQNDLFAEGVPDSYIIKILEWCKRFDNNYLFQSKNPQRFIKYASFFPANTSLCTTIETNRRYKQMGNTPDPIERSHALTILSDFHTQITIEPIMDFDMDEMVGLIRDAKPNNVNIGADSKGNHLPEPPKEKILELIEELKKFTIIDQKRNLARLLK